MNNKHSPSWKNLLAVPFLILFALFILPMQAFIRRLRGKSFPIASLVLHENDLQLLEQASKENIPIFINDQKTLLKSFYADKQHIHPSCGSCPDELNIDDISGRSRLFASRERGESLWKVHAMRSVVWGLLGHIGDDLRTLRMNGQSIGNNPK